MIAIRMRFLAGRLHATPWGHHVNEGVVEYPPSLFRLLRSLVATTRRACLDNITEEQLRRIVNALCSPPEFHLPQAAAAHTRHYDQANSGVKFFDTFVVLRPQDELVWLWHKASLDEVDRLALSNLLTALGTFGRAESWCEAELLNETELGELSINAERINSRPLGQAMNLAGQETIRLLMPREELDPDELMKTLETETSVMRKNKQLEPTGTHWITYTRPSGILTPRRYKRASAKQKPNPVTMARYALDSTVLPLTQDTLPFAEQVRRALIRNRVDTSHSEAIVGKTIDGTPLDGHLHAHYLATDEDGDGRLDHLTIIAQRGFDESDVKALGSLRTIFRHGNRPDVRMVLTGLGETGQFPDLPLMNSSRNWRSVTPFSLPRFANRGGGKAPRPRDLPEAQLIRELKSRGFPEPITIKRIEGYEVGGRPMVRWLEFHTRRYNGTEGHGLAGFEIEFPEPVRGPIAVGFGCHFGLGLFMPA
ncbi:MAG: type I-U CRISPR-associated protein Cas5/Cas6 [Acidobacteriota bacterium]|nr:MAG: type I-U CRISPR-associated protein Cas5/Cas6 [Acidobacteriota bacterium]